MGSLASGVYGEPRLTHDIDIVVELRPDQVAKLCEAFPSPEYYVSQQAVREAVASGGQFNVIHPASGNKIDFMLAGGRWGAARSAVAARSRSCPAGPATRRAEDLIIGKLWYYRDGGSEKHLRDIAAMCR